MLNLFSNSRKKDTFDFVVPMAYMAEKKEWDCRPHIERIRKYALLIGGGINIHRDDLELISIACQLHDIGKITIPDHLVNKDGKYDAPERVIIERHTSEGAKILVDSTNPVLQLAESIARTHHERWDGSGYPQQLRGGEIPLGGRICALADVFDALTTRRSYKQTITNEEAYRLIVESSGVMFDPTLVLVFRDRFEEIKRVKSSSEI